MPEVSLSEWKEYLNRHAGAHVLQTAEWGELKAAFGWEPVRLICEGTGAANTLSEITAWVDSGVHAEAPVRGPDICGQRFVLGRGSLHLQAQACDLAEGGT